MGNERTAVVITCFNYGAYLLEAVDSVRSQYGGAPRILVVDDGSDDPATLALLDRLEDAAGVEVLRQANAGVCAARNAGLAAADRPLLLCLDADDRLPPGALQALTGPLEADPRLGFAYGHPRFFGGLSGTMRFPPYDPLRLLDRHLIGATALMRQQVVLDTGGFDTAFSSYEDWEFWLHALHHGWHGYRVDEVTNEYRRHAGSKFSGDRGRYRAFRRQLRSKHAALYASRAELARQSDLGPVGRAAYRWFWGPRPVPSQVEDVMARLLWPPA